MRALRAHGAYAVALTTAVLGIAFVVRPVLDSGYSGDDVVNSMIPMFRAATGTGFWSHVWAHTDGWMDSVGRFFPVSVFETVLVFSILTSRAAYKVFQFAAVLVDVGLFIVLVSRIARDRWVGVLATLVVAATLQFRFFHDAILQFNAQQATVLALFLGSLLCTHEALVRRRWWWLTPALALWSAALLTYETAYFLFPAFAIVALLRAGTRRERLAVGGAFLVPVLVLGAFVAVLRSGVETDAPAYTLDLSPGRVLPTLLDQTSAALPLSAAAASPHERIPGVPDSVEPPLDAWDPSLPVDALVTVALAAAAVVALVRTRPIDRRAAVALICLGGVLWLGPSTVVAATRRWQEELSLGTGYVSVYLGYFGVALVVTGAVLIGLAALRARGRRRLERVLAGALVAFLGFATQVTADNNDRVVNMYSGLRHMREVFVHAVQRGQFDRLDAGPDVASPLQDWVDEALVAWYGGPDVVFADSATAPGRLDPCEAGGCASKVAVAYLLEHGWALARAGRPEPAPAEAAFAWVQLSRVARTLPAGDGTVRVLTDEIRLYLEDDRLGRPGGPAVRLTTDWLPSGAPPDAFERRALRADEITVAAAGDRWRLLVLRPASGSFSAADVGVTIP